MLTSDEIQKLGTTEAVKYLSRTVPEVDRAFREKEAGRMDYEQCLEMMVITLANSLEDYQNLYLGRMMNSPQPTPFLNDK